MITPGRRLDIVALILPVNQMTRVRFTPWQNNAFNLICLGPRKLLEPNKNNQGIMTEFDSPLARYTSEIKNVVILALNTF